MTTETRTLIEPADIGAVEFECPHCKVKILYPVNGISQLSANCPTCGRPWFASNPPALHPTTPQPVERAKAAIMGLQALFLSAAVHATIRFEISPKISN